MPRAMLLVTLTFDTGSLQAPAGVLISMSSVSRPAVPSISPERAAPARRMSVPVAIAILVVVTAIFFVLQLRHFSPFMTDDAYISLRYSQRLMQGHGLTWNDMRPVEGYTNFLWVLVCAGLGELGLPLPVAAHLLGITTTLLILVAVVLYIYRNYPQQVQFVSALIACCAMVLSSPFSMWSLGGLEQPLLACMLVWAAYLMLGWLDAHRPSTGRASAIGLLLGLAVISRADAAIFTAAFYAAAVIADGISIRSLLSRARILPIPILFFLGQLIFRKSYYHEWVPNTAYVKVAFTSHRLHTGLRYLYFGLKINIVFLALAIIGAYALWRAGRKKTVVFLATIAVIWTFYLVVIGGDIFPAVRHFEPLVALFGFLVAGCGLLAVDVEGRWKRGTIIGLLALTALVATSDAMSDQEHWELEGESLGLFLHQAFGSRQPLLSSDAAGVVPFYAELPVLDPLGLNDYHIAHEASRDRGHGWVGHELGDGKYILDQKPDLLLFSSFEGDGPLFPADQQIVDDPRFAKFYQEVRFDTPQPNSIRSLMYLRRIDGRIGIQEQDGKVIVPAYLEKTDLANSIRLADGQATLVIPPHGQAAYQSVPAASGVWAASIQGPASAAVQLKPAAATASVDGCAMCVRAIDGQLDFTLLNTSDAPALLRSITFDRR